MYILKSLHGVATVQTLSRLNRICPPFEKKTFVLDFVNSYESVLSDFSTFYTTTILSHSVKPENIYVIENRLDGYHFLEQDDIEEFANLLYLSDMGSKERTRMHKLLQRSQKKVEESLFRPEIFSDVNSFIRLYEFLIQTTCFEDVELHKKYDFISYLKSYLKINRPGNGFNLKDKVKISNFSQNKTAEITKSNIKPKPCLSHPEVNQITLPDERKKKLSEIIEEMNFIKSKNYNTDTITQAMSTIVNLMKKSNELKKSAKNNSYEDFDFPLYDAIEDVLIEGMTREEEFYEYTH